MSFAVASLCLLIGFVYVIVPGPIFLSLLALIACRGKRAGRRLIAGCLIGDLSWTGLALLSLVSSRLIEPRLFMALSALCGLYLIYLAVKALRTTTNLMENDAMNIARPLRRGVALGLFNPKSYPVMLSLLTGFVGYSFAGLSGIGLWLQAGFVYLGVSIGILGAYGLFVFICAAPLVKRLFLTHSVIISRIIGLIFLFFGSSLIIQLLRGFLA